MGLPVRSVMVLVRDVFQMSVFVPDLRGETTFLFTRHETSIRVKPKVALSPFGLYVYSYSLEAEVVRQGGTLDQTGRERGTYSIRTAEQPAI